MVTTSGHNLGYASIVLSLSVTLLLLPLVLYRIHLATTRLVLESDNLKHWWMVTSSRTSSPIQMAQAVVPSYNASTVAQSTSTSMPSPVEESAAYSLQCGADQIIQQIISEKLRQFSGVENSTRSTRNTKKSAASQPALPSNLTVLQVPSLTSSTLSQTERCELERQFLQTVVERVISISQIRCRRKKKLVKLWHKPKPEPLLTKHLPELHDNIDRLIRTFDRRHRLYGNKEYADLLWKRLEGSVHSNISSHGKLLFHVTVFNMEDQFANYGLKTNQRWLWEVHNSHTDGRTRVVLVLALPPPQLASPVDLDLLDCLQQEAVSPMVPATSAGCGGPIKLPHCTPKPQEKAEKVFLRCGGDTSKMGVGVICWGCSVWHRWSKHFPVLHIQGQNMWNNVVWMDNTL